MMIDLEDNVWSFGEGSFGQLGLGNQVEIFKPTQIPNLKAKFVTCGGLHTVIIDLQDNIWSFGWNSHRQLGLGDKNDRSNPTQILNLKAESAAAGNRYTVVIDKANVWSFGDNSDGQLGLGPNKLTAVPALPTFPTLPRITTGAGTAIPTKIPNLKAKFVACGGHYTVVIS